MGVGDIWSLLDFGVWHAVLPSAGCQSVRENKRTTSHRRDTVWGSIPQVLLFMLETKLSLRFLLLAWGSVPPERKIFYNLALDTFRTFLLFHNGLSRSIHAWPGGVQAVFVILCPFGFISFTWSSKLFLAHCIFIKWLPAFFSFLFLVNLYFGLGINLCNPYALVLKPWIKHLWSWDTNLGVIIFLCVIFKYIWCWFSRAPPLLW